MRFLVFAVISMVAVANAKVVGTEIKYKDGSKSLLGYAAYDDEKLGRLPAVIVVHNWMGITEATKERVNMLADLGFYAFAADIYGEGVRPKDAKEASELATKYKQDIKSLRSRMNAAFNTVKKQSKVHPGKIAAMGYCFGGTAALELARNGTPVSGVISFHGGLATPNPKDAKNIKGKVLVLHGADDPYVPNTEVEAFQKEMREAGVDWQMVSYGGAVHSFTEKSAGNDNSKGAAYNEKADKRSWMAMQFFFNEIF